MKAKKYVAAGMSFAMAASLLSGCGAKTETPAANGTEAPATTGAPESTKKDSSTINVIAGDNSKPNPAKTRAGAENTLIIGNTEPKGELLPIYFSAQTDRLLVDLMFEPLIYHDEKGARIPVIAEAVPEPSEDHKSYTFKIKKGLKFSDGTELTAKDVKFTYTALCDPSYDGRYYFGGAELIQGAQEYKEKKADEVTGLKVIDDYTIEFTFKEPSAGNLNVISGTGIMPADHYAYEKGNTKQLRDKMVAFDIVGSGPYKLKKFVPKQYVEFTRNENYGNGDPAKIENIIVKTVTPETQLAELEKGTVDVVLRVPTRAENLEQGQEMSFVDIRQFPENAYGFLMYNLKDPRFAEKEVRQALTYGFDREKFDAIYYGPGNSNVTNVPISMVSWAYTDELAQKANQYKYDPAKAEQMLDAAGWKKGADGIRAKDGQRLDFKWYTYTESKYVETLIPLLKEDWMKIGVKVEPELMEFNTMVEKVFTKQEFAITNLSWAMTPDPDDSFTTFHSSGYVPDGNNAGAFLNPENDKLLEAARKEFDQEKRAKLYSDWALLVNEEQPYTFLNQSLQSDFINNRVKNFNTASYQNFAQVIKGVELEK
ncbi:MAG: ABC transporter substrate-binding protein [Cellulosilyticaceae bacterium]